jgi:hypothetical protein
MSGYYGSRSRNTSRHQQDRSHERSDPFDFGDDFMEGIGGDFFGDSSRGRNPGYTTQEYRPQEFSPSSPRRGRAENSYATENFYPGGGRSGSAARPSTSRKQRAGSVDSSSRSITPPPVRNYGGGSAYRAESPGYVPQGRSTYSQARPRSPSPVCNTRQYSPSLQAARLRRLIISRRIARLVRQERVLAPLATPTELATILLVTVTLLQGLTAPTRLRHSRRAINARLAIDLEAGDSRKTVLQRRTNTGTRDSPKE